jgi:hypothetical protein
MGLVPWLLRLGGTNRADVALAAQVCDRLDLPEPALALLKTAPAEVLTPEEEVVNLKSLFRTGRFREFATRWDQVGQQFESHPELSLYRAAYLAGWGQPGQMTPAAERLAEAARSHAQEVLASRLQLSVFAKLLDAEGYGQALARLERAQADVLSERIGYWRLLSSLGQTAQARELAEAQVARVGSAWEVAQLAKTYLSLDLPDRARAVLDRYGPQYGDSESEWATEIWVTYARLLAEGRDWSTLEQLAVRLRALKRAGPPLAGLSYLFEGRAQMAQGLQDQAAASFARLADFTFPNVNAGLTVGRSLIELGYPEIAVKVLNKLEPAPEHAADYWRAMFEALYAVRQDGAALAQAARKAHEAQPANTALMSNYAAALLINRVQPDEAIQLTLSVISRLPESLVAQVNHAFALILGQRFEEAEQVLRRISPASLDEQQRTLYHLGLAEAFLGRRQFKEAGKELNLVQSKYLFPNQIERVERLKAQVVAAVGG